MKTARFTLTNENIAQYVRVLREVGKVNNADSRMLLASCLSLEELLINFQSHFGTEKTIQLTMRKRFNDLQIILRLPGECYNPVDNADSEENRIIVDSLGMAPKYTYFYSTNHVSFSLKCSRGKNELLEIPFSVVIGVLLGVFGNYLPESILTPCHTIIKAILDGIFSLLKMASLPVIFLCVVYGIIGSGGVSTFKENGLSVLRKFFRTMLLMLLLATGICIIAFGIKLTAATSEIPLVNTLVDSLFSILPDNIIAPFVNGDNVKVIILGVIFGCALLSINDKVTLVHQLTNQLKDTCSVVMGWVGKLIPLLIVVVLIDNIWSGTIGTELFTLWKIVALYFAIIMLILFVLMLMVSRRRKLPFETVAKTVLLPGLKGFISGSSLLCYYDMVDGLVNQLKIPEEKANFGIPMAVAFYQPIILLYALFVLFFVGRTNMPVDAGWLVSFLLVVFFASIAAPPVSGGAVSLLAILFSTLGVSDPMTAIAFPLFMLLDYPHTGFRVTAMMLLVASDKKNAEP